MTKSELRQELKNIRLALSPEDRQTKSAAIVSQLWQAMDWSVARVAHIYEPIERNGEVNISDFIIALKNEYPTLQLFTSRKFNDVWRIVPLNIRKSVTKPDEDTLFDVILVPMLGFDAGLHRLGYGGGYYDRFLAIQPTAKKIGVCFDCGRVDHIPTEPHDIPLDIIVTETQKLVANDSVH